MPQQKSYSQFLNILFDAQCKVIWFSSTSNLKLFTSVRVTSIAVILTVTSWRARLFPVHSPCRKQSYPVCCWRTFYILLITHFGQMSLSHQVKHSPTILFYYALQWMSMQGENTSSSGGQKLLIHKQSQSSRGERTKAILFKRPKTKQVCIVIKDLLLKTQPLKTS